MKLYNYVTSSYIITGLLLTVLTVGAQADEIPVTYEEIGKKSVMEVKQEVLENLSTEEQKWYQTFHDGILFFDGWSSISQDILEIYPTDQVAERSPLIQRLGIKIGTEWCKQNRDRRIDTPQLKEWGKRLRGSIVEGPESTTKTLLEIEQEVDLLLKDSTDLTLVSPQS